MKSKDQEKVNKIFDATLDVVAKGGLSGLTMAKISDASGLGMGSIYNYFENKEEIIKELFLALEFKHSRNIYSEVIDGDPFMINLKRIFNTYFMNRWENEDDFKFIDQYRNSGLMTESVLRNEELLYSRAYEILEQGKKELLVKYVDNKILLSFMTGGIKEIVNQMKKYQLPLDQKMVHTTFTLCAGVMLK